MLDRLRPRQRTLAFFALLAFGSIGVLAAALVLAEARLDQPQARQAFITAGIIGSFGIFGFVAVMWLIFDDMVVRPMERLAAAMQAHAATDMRRGIDADTARHLGDLAKGAAALTSRLASARAEAD